VLCLVEQYRAIIIRSRKFACVSALLDGHANFPIILSLWYNETHSSNINFICFFLWRFERLRGHDLQLRGDHTHWTHHARYDSSGRAIGPTQRTLLENTKQSQERIIHAPRRDSNPQSQEANSCRHTAQTARPPGSALLLYLVFCKLHNRKCFHSFMPTCARNVWRILLNI